MNEDGTYQDPAYQDITYTSTGTYTITVHKKAKSSITFVTDPSDAVVSVYDSKGERVEPSKDASVYDSLYYGDEYTWNVSRHGYISRREKFTVGEETEIQVKLEQRQRSQRSRIMTGAVTGTVKQTTGSPIPPRRPARIQRCRNGPCIWMQRDGMQHLPLH